MNFSKYEQVLLLCMIWGAMLMVAAELVILELTREHPKWKAIWEYNRLLVGLENTSGPLLQYPAP